MSWPDALVRIAPMFVVAVCVWAIYGREDSDA